MARICRVPRPVVPDGDMLRANVDFDRSASISGYQSNHRCLASAHLGDELHQSINGPARSLFVVLSPRVIDKLGYIGNLIHAA
jgi:hypothetical protein